MERELKERLRVVGEMAEKFFPHGFCSEVLTLVDRLPREDAAGVLTSYDFFLQTQRKYQDIAHRVYEELVSAMKGNYPGGNAWRLNYLVEAANAPYEEEHLAPFERALRDCRTIPSQAHGERELKRVMGGIASLAFVMQDSPAYPSERALKFYQFSYSAGRFKTVEPRALLRHVLPHGERLLEEHRALTAKAVRGVALSSA